MMILHLFQATVIHYINYQYMINSNSLWGRFQLAAQGFWGWWLLRPEHSTSPQSWQAFLQFFLLPLPVQFWLPHFWHVRSCRDFFEACWLLRESSGLRFLEEDLDWFEGPASEMCEVSRMGNNGEWWCTIFLDELLGGFSCSPNVIEWYSDTPVDEGWARELIWCDGNLLLQDRWRSCRSLWAMVLVLKSFDFYDGLGQRTFLINITEPLVMVSLKMFSQLQCSS